MLYTLDVVTVFFIFLFLYSVIEVLYLYSVVGDSMKSHNGSQFSTPDQDNDGNYRFNCAVDYHGAWWYWSCYSSNLNGEYGGPGASGFTYILWEWEDNFESLKGTTMMVRPKT
jgi:ficolin